LEPTGLASRTVMAVPAGRVTGLLPNQLDALCGALVSELSSDGDGLVEQPIDMQIETSSDARIAKRRCTDTSCYGILIVARPAYHVEGGRFKTVTKVTAR
jgi:hypothetical protein